MALYIREQSNPNRSVTTMYKGRRLFGVVYQGTKLIWQYVRSCFGRGYWINDKPWSNDNGWKN
jgi:hypothetical protein